MMKRQTTSIGSRPIAGGCALLLGGHFAFAGHPGSCRVAITPLDRSRQRRIEEVTRPTIPAPPSDTSVTYVLIYDNHTVSLQQPLYSSGPGAPTHPFYVWAPKNLLQPVIVNNMNYEGYEFLPFSTNYIKQDQDHPATAIYGYGIFQPGGPSTGTTGGTIPQAAFPVGVPLAPETPVDDFSDFNQAMQNLLSMLEAPAPPTAPAGKILEASVHDRDVRMASKDMPHPSSNPRKG